MKATYHPNELVHVRDESQQEQTRTRQIFETLKQKVINGEYLSEHEKEFFCSGVELSQWNDGKWEDYQCCWNPIFKYRYLTYFTDISGGGPYFDLKGTTIYRVKPEQSIRELNYLYNEAASWEIIVSRFNHKEELLQQSCAETRNDLKLLAKEPQFVNDTYARGSFLYKYKRIGILLRSKFLYLKSLEILEILNSDDFQILLNKDNIEFNEYSLIHILSRHFAEATQQYSTGKSYHSMDFIPWMLLKQLKDILTRIDKSKLFVGESLDKIVFKFKEQDYVIWTHRRIKAIKGHGNVSYRRLESFYPINDKVELSNLQTKYKSHKIDADLHVYLQL